MNAAYADGDGCIN